MARKGIIYFASKKVYDIPRSYFEYQYLKDLINYIALLIKLDFEEEFDEALFFAERMKEQIKPKLTVEDINTDVNKLCEELNQLSLILGKDYNLKLSTYHKSVK